MKKLLFFISALAGLFFAASCEREEMAPASENAVVTYSVEIPEITTRAIGDDVSNINNLVYAVYCTAADNLEAAQQDNNLQLLYQKNCSMSGGRATIPFELVNDKNYLILFWAQHDNVWGRNDTELKTPVSFAETTSANNNDLAAFSGVDFLKSDNLAVKRNLTLERAVAQINIATTLADEFTINPTTSKVVVKKAGAQFNIVTQSAEGNANITFETAAVPAGYLNVNSTDYKYTAMNYIFANGNVEIDYYIDYTTGTTVAGTVENTVISVPVKKNYRTNIVGNLLTSNASYEVVLGEWGTPDSNINVWDGSSMNAPEFNSELNAYVVKESSELAWLAAAVNGTLPETKAAVAADNFAGKTFKLTTDINLNNEDWTPIGSQSNPFKGTFDGNGFTVSNLKITGNNSNVGLFGFTTDGEIKNLTVENASVSGRTGVGVVSGQPYTSKYTNITVKGHVEVNGMAYVGGVGGRNAYANWTDITVNVDKTSYVDANSVEDGTAYRTYVGGVVGFNGEGGHTFKNITSNINVKGSTIDVGGLFGIAHYGNNFENCSCSANVEIYAAEGAEYAEQIGGIAGVWNNGGANVTLTNCAFTGTLKTNIPEGVDLSDNTLTGNAYSEEGPGKLIVNGYEYVANGVGKDNDVNYFVYNAEGLKWVANAVNNNTTVKSVKLLNDIDLNDQEWTPIGSKSNPFKGTFDGNGFSVKNLTITGYNSNVGLFGHTTGGEIKNLTVENAKVSGRLEVGVVSGSPYTSKYTNITVKGHIEVNGFAYVGTVGGKNAYANWTDITVNADEYSYVQADSREDGKAYRTYVGGVVGFNGEGSHTFKNITSNIDVQGSTCDVGGLFGIAHYGNNFENCSSSGNVEIYAAEEAEDAEQIGGIAGVWNNGGANVTLTNCAFTGTLKANIIEGVDLSDNSLTGSAYSEEGPGKLIVDGYEFITDGLLYDSKTKSYRVNKANGLVYLSSTTIKAAENVILTADIDLAGIEFNGLKAFNPEEKNTFDGQGYKVSNWTNNNDASDMGFIKEWVGSIKNLTIDNAHLKTNGRSAVLAGKVYANIENCHVTNSSIDDSYWACGLIAGLYNSGNIKNCSATNSTVKSNGGTAAIVGVLNETAGTRSFENCTVTGCTVNNTGNYGEGYSAALICGMINISNSTVNFKNCIYSDNNKVGKYIGDRYYSDGGNTIIE